MSSDAPPSYDQATSDQKGGSNRPKSQNGIPVRSRRSMEDEMRPLPPGWVRQFDAKSHHQFYVDTRATPPRSIWHHPYDDQDYLESIPPEERERIEEENANPVPRRDAKPAGSAGAGDKGGPSNYAAGVGAGPSPSNNPNDPYSALGPQEAPAKGIKKFGRSLKDKMTGTTHEQRETERRERDLQEQREYEMHQRIRAAMARAMQTGQPQLIGRDKNGKDVYIEPPNYGPPGQYGRPNYYQGGGYGYNPYQQGPYQQPYRQNPNAVYVRPDYPYDRPYGSGYGGGIGLPIVGGLLGGAILGSLLF